MLCLAMAISSGAQVFAQSASTGIPQPVSKVWNPDAGDGTYKNPVLYADYSDPDVIRVGSDFYLVASSFDAVPASRFCIP